METNETEVTLSQKEIVRAATNAPELAVDEFILGDRTFKVVDLAYDDYMLYMTHLGPMLEAVVGGVMAVQGVGSGTSITPKDILKHLSGALPELVCLSCQQTEPLMTVSEVKRLGKTPFKLAEIVLKQIEQNRMISDIASFFGQMLPVIKTALNLNR